MSSALELSPSPRPIGFFKIRQITDAGPDRNDFDSFNLANDFKFHSSAVLSDNLIEVRQDGHGFLSLPLRMGKPRAWLYAQPDHPAKSDP